MKNTIIALTSAFSVAGPFVIPVTAEPHSLLDCGRLPLISQTNVCKTQQAYLDGNILEMMRNARLSLRAQPENIVVAQNVFGLLDESYRTHDGSLPSDLQLPKGISYFKIRIKRRYKAETQGVRFSFTAITGIKEPGQVAQFQLRRSSDQKVVLDKIGKVGESEEERDPDGSLYFSIWSESTPEPPEEGLYEVTFQDRTGLVTKLEVILSQMISSASPTIVRPTVGEVFTSPQIDFHVEDFRSPEFGGFEKRKMRLVVVNQKSDRTVWQREIPKPMSQKVTAGPLASGDYILMLSFGEIRNQGPIKLDRESATYVPFSVRAP